MTANTLTALRMERLLSTKSLGTGPQHHPPARGGSPVNGITIPSRPSNTSVVDKVSLSLGRGPGRGSGSARLSSRQGNARRDPRSRAPPESRGTVHGHRRNRQGRGISNPGSRLEAGAKSCSRGRSGSVCRNCPTRACEPSRREHRAVSVEALGVQGMEEASSRRLIPAFKLPATPCARPHWTQDHPASPRTQSAHVPSHTAYVKSPA